jgi:hypothetical protein
MTLRPALLFHFLCLGVLRCASFLVPGPQRAEWWMEWRSELWHVRQACTPERGVSWIAEREVAAFCFGAFQDALCLRAHFGRRRVPHATTMGSATQCILLLACLIATSYGVALLLPGVSAVLHLPRYRDAQNLMLVRDAHSPNESVPTVPADQFRLWKNRKQQIFDAFAFYQVGKESVSSASNEQISLGIAHASSNLFDLLGQPVWSVSAESKPQSDLPKLILSNAAWKRDFGGDPHISGRLVRVGSNRAVVSGVVPEGYWRLPGKVDAWLLQPDAELASGGAGFVVAHLSLSSIHAHWGESWNMSAPKPDGSADDFSCVSLKERTRGPWDIFLFAIFLASLALPATTSLPLGEYRLSSRRRSWSTRLRRWTFLGSKLALLLPIVYLVSLDLAHLRATVDPISSEYIQLLSSFSICLFGLRWALRDQRQRCPVCLRKLTHPARVGQPSRSFLAWNGTELICIGGHGLLHVPEMPTSWFSTQRWLYLDPSWDVLFAESGLASATYF